MSSFDLVAFTEMFHFHQRTLRRVVGCGQPVFQVCYVLEIWITKEYMKQFTLSVYGAIIKADQISSVGMHNTSTFLSEAQIQALDHRELRLEDSRKCHGRRWVNDNLKDG